VADVARLRLTKDRRIGRSIKRWFRRIAKVSPTSSEADMQIAEKAVWIIERHSEGELTLNRLAEDCGVSRSHLAYAFGAAMRMPVMTYHRARRLSEAAKALAKGAPDILAVALDAGYASHEAFTRAFRDLFSVTPETVRDRGNLDGLTLVEAVQPAAASEDRLAPPRLAEAPALRIVGLAETCSFATTITIAAQWQRFMAYYAAIETKRGIPLGVSEAPDDDGRFRYVCATEVARLSDQPKELLAEEIPARTYAVFSHDTHVSALPKTYAVALNDALPALGYAVADAPILERHKESFDPRSGEGGVDLWIPLRL
jgi:AraC family transcriptional regulator